MNHTDAFDELFTDEVVCEPLKIYHPWKILVVDDEDDIHAVIKLALENITFEEKYLEMISVYSAIEGQKILTDDPDIALIFLDVVMESNTAGLDLVKVIREKLRNDLVRIVLQTGYPGLAPEKEVISTYDINDYRTKTELTSDNIFTIVISGLRSYHTLKSLKAYHLKLENEVDRRKQSESRALHLNSILNTIRSINQFIVHEDDPIHLIQGICQKLTDIDGYYNAWIALVEESGNRIIPAQDGLGDSLLPVIRLLEEDRYPYCVGTALKQPGVLTIENPCKTCRDCPLSKKYSDKGIISVRLEQAEKVYGLLTLAVCRKSIYDEEELSLIQDLATDISFALHGIEEKNKRIEAENYSKKIEAKKEQLEYQLRQAQKMEAIGTLAGGIAHDFNNILFPIIGFVELMLDRAPEDSEFRDSLIEVFNAATRASELVKQILSFSRQSDYELKPLRLKLIIKDVIKFARSFLPATIEIDQDIHNCSMVLADSTQIHQIAMNLITNAYHAMEDKGGKLTIFLTEVNFSQDNLQDQNLLMKPGKYVCLKVADTGIGMNHSIMERIFEPYFTTKQKLKGTGLGLSVVHGIVKSYGGNVSCTSEPGKGTEFTVYFPTVKITKITSDDKTKEIVPKGTERILIIDDEESIVRLMRQMLERLGYRVTQHTGSIEALEAFKAKPDDYDLVITDMTMSQMTGIQFSQKLLSIRPGIPIILCTGFSEQISEEKAKAMGIREYVMKPIARSELAKTIRKVLDTTPRL
jgi:signal transduction histidine kinase/DNA-binding response OmpR family regulator